MFEFIKRINDPVHGAIGLTQFEVDIISLPVFQRLHHVQQLGLGALVYPGANYSRFAHSVGACHVMGEMLAAISRNANHEFAPEEWQLYRLGGLLHDIGHFPFSHAFEHVVVDYYKPLAMLGDDSDEAAADPLSYDHEMMGRQIIQKDSGIVETIKAHGYEPRNIRAIFTGELPEFLTPLISSDLDCDRLDYLMRTSHHAGLPYGKVDVGYIVDQMTLDLSSRPCLTRKAIRAADHFLISRYFDYTQVAYHKTVVALELALETIVKRMLERSILDCSAEAMNQRLDEGRWAEFDDQHVMRLMREEFESVRDDPAENVYKSYLASVLFRQPPKMVLMNETIRDRNHEEIFAGLVQQVREKIPEWADETGISHQLWLVWDKNLSLTKFGSDVPIDVVGDDYLEEESRTQLIWIKGARENDPNGIDRLVSLPGTLVHTLSGLKFFGIRVYVNLSGYDGDAAAKRREISSRIAADLPHLA